MMNDNPKIAELAGYCNELTLWRILAETSEFFLHNELRPINPDCIEINDDGRLSFGTAMKSSDPDGFAAPETPGRQLTEPGLVWSLGAIVFFVVMGRQVMNGKGGAGQKESSKLPYMRSEWPEASELIQRCLLFNPVQRPSLQQVHEVASKQYQRCLEDVRKGPKIKKLNKNSAEATAMVDQDLAFWPDSMQIPSMNP